MGGDRSGQGRGTVATVVGLLAVWNLVVNLALPSVAYVPANALAAAGLLLIGRRRALSWAQLGVGRDRAGAGLRIGIAAGAAIAVVIGALVTWPWSRRFFEDGSLVGVGVAGMLYQVLVRIPLGTALFEEVAFRGVLLGAWRRAGLRAAGAATSALFGLWHVVPTLGRLDLNAAGGYRDVGRRGGDRWRGRRLHRRRRSGVRVAAGAIWQPRGAGVCSRDGQLVGLPPGVARRRMSSTPAASTGATAAGRSHESASAMPPPAMAANPTHAAAAAVSDTAARRGSPVGRRS
jgi:hypothetical protein